MNSFTEFLECCKDELNHHGQNVKDSFENNWLPILQDFRNKKELPTHHRYNHLVLEGIFRHSLSNEEAFFILSHTGSYSSWINGSLRSGRQFDTQCQQYFADKLNEALSKLPCFNDKKVYRMDEPLTDDIEQVFSFFEKNNGKVMRTPYFLSTSKDNWENTSLTWDIKTLQEDSKARDLSLITNNNTEKEVLFKGDSYFKIKGVNRGSKIVFMEEVSECTMDADLVGFYFEK